MWRACIAGLILIAYIQAYNSKQNMEVNFYGVIFMYSEIHILIRLNWGF